MNFRTFWSSIEGKLILMSVLLSLVAFAVITAQGIGFLHFDTQARLLIARRVCDSTSPGLAQLGAVWLPLTHIASYPLVCSDIWANSPMGIFVMVLVAIIATVFVWKWQHWNVNQKALGTVITMVATTAVWLILRSNMFYTQGIGMILLSMLSYWLLGYFLFRFVKELTGSNGASLVAWAVIMLNPNILYLQGTSMTELPMYFGVLLSMYTFWRLCKEPSSLNWIFWNGISAFIMTLIRYEPWVILVLETAIYALVMLLKRYKLGDIVGHLVQWGFLSWVGVIGWIAWNITIFSNPLEFQNGAYAAPSNWVSGREAGLGNLRVAFETYIWGIGDTIGGFIVVLGLIALIYHVLSTRLNKEGYALYLPLIMIPFFGFMIYKGQRPMQVMQIENTLYNIRFALIIILSIGPLIGYMVRGSKYLQVVCGVAVVITQVLLANNPGITTLIEPQRASSFEFSQLQIEASEWLEDNYDGASMLLEAYGNEQIQFLSGINLGEIIYEGTYQLWEPILNAPYANNIEWVVMRGPYSSFPQDKVWDTVRQQQSFWDHYNLVYQNDLYQIYRLEANTANQ